MDSLKSATHLHSIYDQMRINNWMPICKNYHKALKKVKIKSKRMNIKFILKFKKANKNK